MRRPHALVLAALLATQAGCFATTFRTGRTGSGQVVERQVDSFFWGLVGEHVVELDLICPGGTARFEVVSKPLDTLLDTVTLGLYSPRTVVVECAVP